MPNRRIFHVILIVFLVFSGGCRSRSHIVNLQSQWSGLDPRSIPLTIREREYARGNLVINPSFEQGRYYNVDTVNLSFNLPGWKKVGEDVYWTDTQNPSGFEPDEASSGTHAIRIERTHADETDLQGEGVISDYLKVIPGNYRLSMDIRLSHVESGLGRLGTNTYDAVNIMLYFYDKNKVLIRNQAYHPAYDHEINNSFKGQPFANFRYINEYGWGRVIARSGNFPFDEGNIPDQARYVRIFAGLKGTGTMWLDMVDFRYSTENFTFLEKVKPLFDSTLERANYLLPKPQKAVDYKEMELIRMSEGGKALKPLVLIPSGADGSYKKTIAGFVGELRNRKLYTSRENPVITRVSSAVLESGRLIFSFGNTELSNQFSGHLPMEEIIDKPQAYYIRRLDAMDNVIFIGASDNEGLHHALATLLQLIDMNDSLYHHYDITDYPDFTRRGMIVPTGGAGLRGFRAADLDFLVSSGINEFIVEPRGDDVSSQNFARLCQPGFKMVTALKKDREYIRTGISLREQNFPVLNSLRSGGIDDFKLKKEFAEAVENEAENTAALTSRFIDDGAEMIIQSDVSIWKCLDLGSPRKSIRMLREKPFLRFMAIRDAYWKAIGENEKPDTSVVTCLFPLFSDNRLKNQMDPGEFCYEKSIEKYSALYGCELWTGPAAYSTIIDDVDLAQFRIDNPLPVKLFDNTLTAREEDVVMGGYPSRYPGKAALGALFQPYAVEMTPGIRKQLKRECILNIGAPDELTLIRLATAADYLWNNSGYDPWFSAWKTLVYRYGKETAEELVWFNDDYYNLLSVCLRLENSGYNQKLLKSGDEIVIQLDSHWGNIKVLLEKDVDFLNDLSDLKNRVLSRFYEAKRLPESGRR